jgi:hypothetical protein
MLPRLLMPSKRALPPVENLPGHNPEPGRELTALAKGGSVSDRGDDSGSHDWADTRDLLDTGAAVVRGGNPLKLIAEFLNLLL